jgi:hypothetical protein
MSAVLNLEIQNSTDATRGQPLVLRVLHRKNELEDALADLGRGDTLLRQAIEMALSRVYLLITGDLAHPSELLARDLNRWLERNKHLAQDFYRSNRR